MATLLLAVQDGYLKQPQTGQGLHITCRLDPAAFLWTECPQPCQVPEGPERSDCQRWRGRQGQARRLGTPARIAPNRMAGESAKAKRRGESSIVGGRRAGEGGPPRGWASAAGLPTSAYF